MRVFFTASFRGKKKFQNFYDLVLDTIETYCDDVISPEAGNYLTVISNKEKMKLKDLHKIHYEAIRRSIQSADVVIMEMSYPDFQLGHEATLAINSKKPVLCLSLDEDISEKIDSHYFFGSKYNANNIDEIVSNFLKRFSKNNLNNRFNMFLSASQLNHIEEKSKKRKLSTSAYVRWLIEKDMGIN